MSNLPPTRGPQPDPKQSGTPLFWYIACVGIGAVAIAAVMAIVLG